VGTPDDREIESGDMTVKMKEKSKKGGVCLGKTDWGKKDSLSGGRIG